MTILTKSVLCSVRTRCYFCLKVAFGD